MPKISNIKAREILDSRGNPTLETKVFLDNGISGTASVPSGASKGIHEAIELRDGDTNRYLGMGVLQAIENIDKILLPLLKGVDITGQQLIDNKMLEADRTDNKGRIGANSILSVSLAVARVAAMELKIPLYLYIYAIFHSVVPDLVRDPKRISNKILKQVQDDKKIVTPLFNIINGGLHGSGKLKFQEFLLIPDQSKNFPQALRIGVEIYQVLKKELIKRNLVHAVGDEGGFTPNLELDTEAINLLIETIESSNYEYGKDVYLGLDLASSVFFKNNLYTLSDGKNLTSENFIEYLVVLTKKYKLFSLEDPLYEDDWDSWQSLTSKLGSNTLIIGDDLLATNIVRLKRAISCNACNSILIKPNQIGTLSETIEVTKLAQKSGFTTVLSHRSGETNDDFIADLAVGIEADFTKFGAPARGERVAKYNRLLEIYEELQI